MAATSSSTGVIWRELHPSPKGTYPRRGPRHAIWFVRCAPARDDESARIERGAFPARRVIGETPLDLR